MQNQQQRKVPITINSQQQQQSSDPLKNKRKKPTDKTLGKKFEAFLPEAKIYANMLELEKRVDATIVRKTLDINGVLQKPPIKTTRTLRVFLSNLAVNQASPDELQSLSPEKSPAWTFRLEGRLLDIPSVRKQPGISPKFSSFVKRVVVEIDRDNQLYPGNIIEWNKPGGLAEVEGFEIKRRGDQEVDLKINLYFDHSPEIHKLSPGLANLLDLHSDTLPNVIMAIWQYAKSYKLQDIEDRRVIVCDEKLIKIAITNLPSLLQLHMFPIDPVTLSYTIRLDKEYNMNPQAFDIPVQIVDPIRESYMKASSATINIQKEIGVLDEKICALVQTIQMSKLKRDFMHGFASDPVNFINKWMASQSRDLEVVLGDTRINIEEAQSTKFFQDENFQEALFHYLRSNDLQ